jgi:predicted metal-dependent hydrolase
VSHKTEKVFQLLAGVDRKGHDIRYAGYFELFNRGEFYNAHDVLEDLWLPVRKQHEGDFYKGLIQLAGAFVHLQKERLRPAGALFKLARTNLSKFAPEFEFLNLKPVLELIDQSLNTLEVSAFANNPLAISPPHLEITVRSGS